MYRGRTPFPEPVDDDHVVGQRVLVLQRLHADGALQSGCGGVHGLDVPDPVALGDKVLEAQEAAPGALAVPGIRLH